MEEAELGGGQASRRLPPLRFQEAQHWPCPVGSPKGQEQESLVQSGLGPVAETGHRVAICRDERRAGPGPCSSGMVCVPLAAAHVPHAPLRGPLTRSPPLAISGEPRVGRQGPVQTEPHGHRAGWPPPAAWPQRLRVTLRLPLGWCSAPGLGVCTLRPRPEAWGPPLPHPSGRHRLHLACRRLEKLCSLAFGQPRMLGVPGHLPQAVVLGPSGNRGLQV